MSVSRGVGRVVRAAWLRPVLVAVLATAGYFLFIPITHLEGARLAALVVAEPGIGGFKATPSGASVQVAARSALGAVRSSAAHAPDATGGYTVSWGGATVPQDALSLSVMLVATPADARHAAGEARATYLAATTYQSESYAFRSQYALAAIPGSTAATYVRSTSKSAPAGQLRIAVFAVGRALTIEFLATTTGSARQLLSVATAQYRHLLAVPADYSISTTSDPPLASVLYGLVAAALMGLAYVVPILGGKARARRRRREQQRAQYQYRSRGRKVLKRQVRGRPPPRQRQRR
ncbi:MAG TPA: hypothetical protein VMU75_02845 [Acidimicrobiales bacterium]|nr:hypothetical protein [Acidimicrobiales bacterium]